MLVRLVARTQTTTSGKLLHGEDPELVKLIANEIRLGFTFVETHRL